MKILRFDLSLVSGSSVNLLRERRATRVENFLPQNCNTSSVLSIFKYNPKGKANNKFITS